MDIPDLYQLKFRIKGKKVWRYGIAYTFSEEAKSLWAMHEMIKVDDAILPKTYLLKYSDAEVVSIPCGFDNEYQDYVEKQQEKAEKKAKSVKSGLKGKIFSVPVGDGSAYYIVKSETSNTVKVEWRGFCLDRWQDNYFQEGGEFNKDRIADMIYQQEEMVKLFDSFKAKKIAS
jgi:hypothetical protein